MDFKKFLTMISEAESTAEKDNKAEKAGKKVAKDIEYDEGHKGKDDDKAEKAGKKVTKDIEYDDKKDKKEKKSLKDWFDAIDKNMLAEAEQLTIEPAKQSTQVIKRGNEVVGSVSNPALAATIKSAIGKGEMSLAGDDLKEEQPMMEKAPPGMEDVVLSLKKKFPGEEGRAYAIAWSMYNKKHGKNEGAEDNPESAMLDETEVEESGLQAYLGNKKYGKAGMDALRKAGREGASKEKMASIRAKYDKLDEEEIDEASEDYSAKKARAGKDIGKPGKNFAKIAKSAAERYGSKEKGEKVAGAVLAKLRKTNEADIPKSGPDYGAGLGAGRSQTTFENKKTKKVNEAMNTLEAAYHEGKSHGLTKHGYACRYDEGTDEHRRYHEGFKEGLDECYGLMPNRGLVVSEVESGQDVVDNMASYGAEEGSLAESNLLATSNDSFTDIDLDIVDPNTNKKVARVLGDSFNGQIYIGDDVYTWEAGGERITNKEGKTIARNVTWDDFLTKKLGKQIEDEYGELLGEMNKTEYMKHKANTTPGDKFKAFGQTFKDKEVLETDAFAFESLDKQLNELLNEGLSVNMSQGLGGPNGDMEDTVSVTAQGDDAGKLLQFIKQVGLGGLGNDQQLDGPSEPVVAVSDYGAPKFTGHDNGGPSMADLLQKMAGEDYKDEEGHDHSHEEKMCEVHGMEEAKCGCGEGKEMVDEVESEDQMEYQVAEDDGEGYEQGQEAAAQIDSALAVGSENEKEVHEGGDGMEGSPEAAGAVAAADADEEQEEAMSESNSFLNLYKKLAWLAEESTAEKDDKAEKAAKKVAKDIEYDEGHKGKDDEKAEKAGEKVKKDIEYDDKKDKKKKVDEWANDAGKDGTQQTFERDIEFMTKVISGGLNKPKSTGQQTIPVLAGDKERTGDEDMAEFRKLAGLGQ